MATNDRDSLLRDLVSETADSWRAMSLPARAILIAGVVGLIVFAMFDWPAISPSVLSSLRVASLVALIAGAIANARVLDEFYQRVYLLACTYTLVVSSIVLYALPEFGLNVGVRSISIVVATFGIAFVAAFAVLRRG